MTNNYSHYPDVLSVKHVRLIAQCGKDSAYKLVNSGQFPTFRVGNRVRIPKTTFLDWMYGSNAIIIN